MMTIKLEDIKAHECSWCYKIKAGCVEYTDYDAGGNKFAEWICKDCF